MKRWQIKEVAFNSLNELNAYIDQEKITPKDLIKYNTIFDQMKQCMRYGITYWKNND